MTWRDAPRFGPRWEGAALLAALLAGGPALAAEAAAPPLGFADRPPTVDAERDVLYTDAVGWVDERLVRWEARRADARRRAEARAREALHAYVDARLAGAMASPRVAADVHEAVEAGAVEADRRPLVDGGSVMRLEVPLPRVREAAGLTELGL